MPPVMYAVYTAIHALDDAASLSLLQSATPFGATDETEDDRAVGYQDTSE